MKARAPLRSAFAPLLTCPARWQASTTSCCLIDPNAPEERRTAAVSEAESLLSSGGEIVDVPGLGPARMAYEIDHRPEAEYRLYQFNGDNELLERLNQRLRINDAVLRFRIIKAKPGQPVPPPPEQQSARRRDEREPQDTRVAARAAADAPAATDEVPGAEDAAEPAAPAESVPQPLPKPRRPRQMRLRPPKHRPRSPPPSPPRTLRPPRTPPLSNGFAKEAAL